MEKADLISLTKDGEGAENRKYAGSSISGIVLNMASFSVLDPLGRTEKFLESGLEMCQRHSYWKWRIQVWRKDSWRRTSALEDAEIAVPWIRAQPPGALSVSLPWGAGGGAEAEGSGLSPCSSRRRWRATGGSVLGHKGDRKRICVV